MSALAAVARTSIVALSFLASSAAQARPSWYEITTPQSPSARDHPALAYHERNDRTVLFGGETQGASGWQVLSDTWTFDGANWQQQSPANSPPARHSAVMGYDPFSGRVIMVGGTPAAGGTRYLWDAWAWDGVDWTRLPDLPDFTDVRECRGAAFDPVLDGLVITSERDTFLFHNGNWTILAPGPQARELTRLFYDPTRDALVAASTTWHRWDRGGGSWQRIPSPNLTQLQVGIGAVDPFTGDATFLHVNRTYRWNIDTWRELLIFPPAYPPRTGALVFDTHRRRMVAVGRGGTNDPLLKTWRLDETPADPEFAVHGQGCGAQSAAPLTMRVEPTISPLPYLGGWLGTRVQPVRVLQPLFSIMGFDNQSWNGAALPLDLSSLGLTGCTLFQSVDILELVGVAPPSGVVLHALEIPIWPSLAGLRFHLQYLAIDPTANAAGAILSNGGTGRIGYR